MAEKLETKEAVAGALATKVFKSNDPSFPIAQFVDEKKERAFLMHLLNGPGSEWVMEVSDFRWVSAHPSDFGVLKILNDFAEYCKSHLI
jgi:hypothetical protein